MAFCGASRVTSPMFFLERVTPWTISLDGIQTHAVVGDPDRSYPCRPAIDDACRLPLNPRTRCLQTKYPPNAQPNSCFTNMSRVSSRQSWFLGGLDNRTPPSPFLEYHHRSVHTLPYGSLPILAGRRRHDLRCYHSGRAVEEG